MARTGMATLISTLRDLCVAGTGDYSLGTTNYWTDDQLQTALDRHYTSVYREELTSIINYNAGTVEYKEYRSLFQNFEQTSGGTSIFEVETAAGSTVATSLWTMDYANGILTFSTDTGGSSYYITGRSYDLNTAAADVWRMKAGHLAAAVDFSTDNMSVKRSSLQKQALDMAKYYGSMGRIQTISFERNDTT